MTNHDDHTTTDSSGPDEASARRAKRFAVAGAAALMLGLGGVGTAYAVGSGPDTTETGYATIVDTPMQAEAEAPATQSGSREDCPEKDGATPSTPGSEAPSQAPSETPDAAPDTSTL